MKTKFKLKIKKIIHLIIKRSSFVLFLFFIALIILAGFIFYKKVYQFLETEGQKPILTSKIKTVKIKEDILKRVLNNLGERDFYISEETKKEFPNPFKP